MSEAKVTRERIMQYGFGFAPPLILEAAVRCRVFDALDAGPKTADEVAAETRVSPRGARALLNALVGLEFLDRQGDRYALAPGAETLLVSTKPGFAGGMFRHTSRQLIPHFVDPEDIDIFRVVDKPADAVKLIRKGIKSH